MTKKLKEPRGNALNSRLAAEIASAQKTADAAKQAAKAAKAVWKQAKKDFKEARRLARIAKKVVKELKAEFARPPVSTKPARKRAESAVGRPASELAVVESVRAVPGEANPAP